MCSSVYISTKYVHIQHKKQQKKEEDLATTIPNLRFQNWLSPYFYIQVCFYSFSLFLVQFFSPDTVNPVFSCKNQCSLLGPFRLNSQINTLRYLIYMQLIALHFAAFTPTFVPCQACMAQKQASAYQIDVNANVSLDSRK